jgi:hypothetical protein
VLRTEESTTATRKLMNSGRQWRSAQQANTTGWNHRQIAELERAAQAKTA